MIKVENLTKRYGSHVAVDGLSFETQKGKVYGLLGVNGAGKSTTMNIITGYLAPSDGKVYVDGEDIMKKPEKAKKHIGYLPEIPPLYPEMTVSEYLTFAAQLKGMKGTKASRFEADRVMEMTGIEEVKNRLIKNLSKGYKQRVGLAQALLTSPEVIILDEPTVGLDPRQIIEIRELIRKLGETHTVILSSHILSEVQAVCDEILIISKGRLVANGTPDELERATASKHELNLAVKGEIPRVKMLLENFDARVDIISCDEGVTKARMSLSSDEDIRETLFYALAEKRMPLMELSVSHTSLEDVFIELTENAGTPAEDETGTDVKDGAGADTVEAEATADEKPLDNDISGGGASEEDTPEPSRESDPAVKADHKQEEE